MTAAHCCLLHHNPVQTVWVRYTTTPYRRFESATPQLRTDVSSPLHHNSVQTFRVWCIPVPSSISAAQIEDQKCYFWFSKALLWHTLAWNLFATEFVCEYLRMFEIAKNMIGKSFNGYIVIIVVVNFCKNFSIKVSWHFCKYFSAQNNSSLQY